MTDFVAFIALIVGCLWLWAAIMVNKNEHTCHSLCEKRGYDYGMLFKNNSCQCDYFDENTFYLPN